MTLLPVIEHDGETYEEVVDGPQPHVIETGDSVKVKQVLDDATSETLIENGFQPNYFWENMKLFLMFLSCVFAMIAQFYPIPFPDSRPLLGFCCAMYFILSSVLQGMITYIDKDIILIGKPDPVSLSKLTLVDKRHFPPLPMS
jgi:signal peptidase complex subunit 2